MHTIAHTDLWLQEPASVKYRAIARLVASTGWTSLHQLSVGLRCKKKTMSSAILSLESRGWIEVLRNPPQAIKDDCGAGGRHISVYRPTQQARAVFSQPVMIPSPSPSPSPAAGVEPGEDYSTPSLLYRFVRSAGVCGMTKYRLIELTLFLPDKARDQALQALQDDGLVVEYLTQFYRGAVDQLGVKLPYESRLFTSYSAVF